MVFDDGQVDGVRGPNWRLLGTLFGGIVLFAVGGTWMMATQGHGIDWNIMNNTGTGQPPVTGEGEVKPEDEVEIPPPPPGGEPTQDELDEWAKDVGELAAGAEPAAVRDDYYETEDRIRQNEEKLARNSRNLEAQRELAFDRVTVQVLGQRLGLR